MSPDPSTAELLEPYRAYLRTLAATQVYRDLQGKLDPSDIVQTVFVKAYEGFSNVRDRSPEVLLTWLQAILKAELVDVVRHFHRQRRDVTRERSLVQDVDHSAEALNGLAAACQPSPSAITVRNEELLRLANAIDALDSDQRTVVILKHLRQCSLAEISVECHKTPAAVAGLLRRGLARLREILDDPHSFL
ncbi:sigma-70 family RNA polymerase sigma factor [Planctomyces sp. SH-PL14]|uniref:sigma-70 family RNA polymerase sigma factor n=1 Tax=Planctomyces sp. SH-PL14 TaxID=1632864 RepID=UPI0009467BA0|nr:sigma-70 family RNA polymerase sigma factor [Planctomyces sp. SH-PL14]